MEKTDHCPLCNETRFSTFMEVPDYFLSGEVFTLSKCLACGMIFTNPRPEPENLGAYYKSEDYVSHSNTKRGLIFRIYHLVRKYNFSQKFKLISHLSRGNKILDVGCATGGFLSYFKKRGWDGTGIEPDAQARKMAVEKEGLSVFDEKELTTLLPQSFDVITLWHVLEHVPYPVERLRVLNSLLKDDGLLVVAIPNPASYDATHYGKFWAGYDVPRHLLHFEQKVATSFFTNVNFELVGIRPMKFDAYYISLMSEKYKTGKMSYLKALKIGWTSNRYAKRHENNFSSLIYLLRKKKTDF